MERGLGGSEVGGGKWVGAWTKCRNCGEVWPARMAAGLVCRTRKPSSRLAITEVILGGGRTWLGVQASDVYP